VTVDATLHGTGEAIRTAPSTVPAEVIEGPIARFSGSESFAFPTVEAAMAAPPFYLLMSLPELRRTDLPGWWIAVEALTRKNPPINLTVTVEETDATFTSDDVIAIAAGHHLATKGGLTLNDGATGTISFRLLDVLMPLIIGADSNVDFEVMSSTTPLNLLERNQQPARLSWGFPFGRQRAEGQRAGSGRYTLDVAVGE
jgi:hypothetical protein